MNSVHADPSRAVWTRIVFTVVALPISLLLVAATVGAGNLPLGGMLAVPLVYLLGVLVMDLKDAWSGRFRNRSRYPLWWLLAVLPSCTWLIWLQMR